MGNFFTRNWFPLNIIIVLVLAGIAVLIWGLVTNWGKGPHHYSPCPSGQEHCAGICIDDTEVCVNGKPCDHEKATQDKKQCCKWRSNDNDCVDCTSPKTKCYKDGHVPDICCLEQNCSQDHGGCCKSKEHNCDYGCCAATCCNTEPGKTECCNEQAGEYCDYSPGPSPYGQCKIKCGVEWCGDDLICEQNSKSLNKGFGLCDDGSDNPTICSEAAPCSGPGPVSCNYGVCSPSSMNACTKDGCSSHTKEHCVMERCSRPSPCTWHSDSLEYIPTPLYVNNKGELCKPKPGDSDECKPKTICNKGGAPGSFFCKDAPGSYHRTATRTEAKGSQCNAYDCLTSTQEPGMTTLDWNDNKCTSEYDCNKDTSFTACPPSCVIKDSDACCKGKKLTGQICFNGTHPLQCADGKCTDGVQCDPKKIYRSDGSYDCTACNTTDPTDPLCKSGTSCNNECKYMLSGAKVVIAFSLTGIKTDSSWMTISNSNTASATGTNVTLSAPSKLDDVNRSNTVFWVPYIPDTSNCKKCDGFFINRGNWVGGTKIPNTKPIPIDIPKYCSSNFPISKTLFGIGTTVLPSYGNNLAWLASEGVSTLTWDSRTFGIRCSDSPIDGHGQNGIFFLEDIPSQNNPQNYGSYRYNTVFKNVTAMGKSSMSVYSQLAGVTSGTNTNIKFYDSTSSTSPFYIIFIPT